MLFALSLIEAPQAARAMVEVAQKGNNETSNLAKAFIDKRDQGIWNNYSVKDLLTGKNLPKPRMLIGSLRPPLVQRQNYPKYPKFLNLRETQRMEKVLSDDAMFAIKWAPSVLNLDQRLPVGEVARIGRLFLRQSLNHQRT